MKHKRLLNIGLVASAGLMLIVGVILASALPVIAGPPKQDSGTPIPTPTLYPVSDDELKRTLETVGGDGSTKSLPGQEVDGIVFGETKVESTIPGSMRFETIVQTDNEIGSLDLFIRFPNGAIIDQSARWDDDIDAWQATLISRGTIQLVTWARVEFKWCVQETEDNQICTDYIPIDYWDPDQEWNRVENQYAVLYWYGFGDDQRDDIARQFTYAITTTHHKLLDGTGQEIRYKPVFVLFPNHQALRLFSPNMPDESFAGVHAIAGQSVHTLTVNIDSCPYLLPPEEQTLDWQLDFALGPNMLWGYAALYIGDLLSPPEGCQDGFGWNCVNLGPFAWADGQATWFANGFWNYDERLRQLAAIRDIPGINAIPNDLTAMVIEWEDGCTAAHADMGASFVNWLVYHYGIETHRQIVELMMYHEDGSPGLDFEDAIEQATGKPFDELENEWRAYLELPPLE